MSAKGRLGIAPLCLMVVLLGLPSASRAWNDREPTAEDVANFDAELKILRGQPDKYRELVATAQMMLGAFGFGTGPFDGVLDAKTRSALRQYQRVRKLVETGDPDAKTWLTLERDFNALRTRIP